MATSGGETTRVPVTAAHRRYDEVDVLRGLAALWVVLSHYLPHWNRYLGWAPVIVPNLWGQYAVWLFFVISGFVIFSTLDRSKSVADFAVLRFSRLYPTYWVTLLFATLASVLVFGEQLWVGGLLANLTMFQKILGYGDFDTVYWSLAVELAFYMNAGVLFALGLHRRPQLIVVSWLGVACIWALALDTPGTVHRDWLALLFALDYSPYFAMGIVFFDVTKHGWSASRAGLIVLALVAEFLISGWLGLRVALFIVPLFVLAIRGRLRFLVSKVTLWLGAISYSLYLIHRNLGYASLNWMHGRHIGPAVAMPIAILGALALATIATYGVEKPAMRHIRMLYDQWKARKRSPGG